jgi:hypothetical protein
MTHPQTPLLTQMRVPKWEPTWDWVDSFPHSLAFPRLWMWLRGCTLGSHLSMTLTLVTSPRLGSWQEASIVGDTLMRKIVSNSKKGVIHVKIHGVKFIVISTPKWTWTNVLNAALRFVKHGQHWFSYRRWKVFSDFFLMMGAQIILDTPVLELSYHAHCTLASPRFFVISHVCLSKVKVYYCAYPFGIDCAYYCWVFL